MGALPGLLAPGVADDLAGLRGRPPLAEPYWLPAKPAPHARFTAQADVLLGGRFRPAGRWPAQELGFPPAWDADPFDDDNWLSGLHSLEWLIPLVHAHAGDPRRGYLEACARAIEDWVVHNPFRGAPSRYSWHDHAAAKRLRLFAWFWEQYRGSESFDPGFARVLVASVYQHARYHLDERNYRPDSNHGLEAIGSLLAAAITFSAFREASDWEQVARTRLVQWLADNLSPEGFHLEQSPSYHWFVLLRLAAIDRFLTVNGHPDPGLAEAVARAARAWPWLVHPDGCVPTIGDGSAQVPADWRRVLARRWGRPVPDADEQRGMMVSPRAGYAVFRSGESRGALHVVFRCRWFVSPHCHYDGLSFVLHARGRLWLGDPGFLNYHEWDPRRQYLRSPRAHSLVIIGAGDWRGAPSECMEWAQSEHGGYVVSYHDLPCGRHARRMEVRFPDTVVVQDRIEAGTRRPRPWCQLFQVAPGLAARIVSPREAHLVAGDGSRCVIMQSREGRWEVVTGEMRPILQGWHSPGYGEWKPGTTLIFQVPPGQPEMETVLKVPPPVGTRD